MGNSIDPAWLDVTEYPNSGYLARTRTVPPVPGTLHSTTYKKLRRALIDARTQSGMTQTDLAARLRRAQSFVSKYESGERHLDVVEFIEVCKALGVSPVVVLDGILA